MSARLEGMEWLAREMLAEHGLAAGGWQFGWNNRATAFGVCRFSVKRIELSRPLAEVNSDDQMLDTIAHEVAHALAGALAGHGPVWQAMAVRLGARPERSSAGESVQHRWLGTCDAGCEIKRHRLAASVSSGALCGRHGLPVEWERV